MALPLPAVGTDHGRDESNLSLNLRYRLTRCCCPSFFAPASKFHGIPSVGPQAAPRPGSVDLDVRSFERHCVPGDECCLAGTLPSCPNGLGKRTGLVPVRFFIGATQIGVDQRETTKMKTILLSIAFATIALEMTSAEEAPKKQWRMVYDL